MKLSNNPLNLAFRFLLEIAALVAMSYWGFHMHGGILKILLGAGLPIAAASFWGVFRVPGDPKHAPIAVSGRVRLVTELIFFLLSAALLYVSGQTSLSIVLFILVIIHYLLSIDRVKWLMNNAVKNQ